MLSRRLLLGGALAATATQADAAIRCMATGQGVERCEVGVELPYFYRAPQECEQWCWAACVQMVFALHGRQVSQQAIVQKVFGGLVCAPAQGPQIIYAVNGQWRDANGYLFQAQAEVLWDAQYGVGAPNVGPITAQELAQGEPLIIGAMGHATMLTAMVYDHDVYGRSQILSMTVRDPWPANQARRVLSAQEAANTQFLARVRVS
jgi:hypothetical protein